MIVDYMLTDTILADGGVSKLNHGSTTRPIDLGFGILNAHEPCTA